MENYEIILKNINNGFVHKVLNKKDNRYYAMKQIPIDDIKKEDLKVIKNNIESLSNIKNLNIVKYYNSFIENNYLYIIMEYCKNGDLRNFIEIHKEEKKFINQNVLYKIILDIISGLKYIHDKKIVHRNLKPENILIDKYYTIKIGDFGIVNQLTKINKSENIKWENNLNYFAPELLSGDKYTNKTDIWALGCVIYELFTLNHCFDSESRRELIRKIKKGSYGKINQELYDSDFQNLIDILLNKDSNARPAINDITLKYEKISKESKKENSQFSSNYLDENILKRESLFRFDLKIIVIGTSGTDKTQFVNKWTKNSFNDTYKSTIVSEYGFKVFEYEERFYRIQLWDVAGEDKNAKLTKTFSKDAHGVIVMTDATDIRTRDDAIKRKNSVDESATFIDGEKLPCILVENKIDLLETPDEDDITLEEFCNKNGFLRGFRASSKTGKNVEESLNFLIEKIIQRMENFADKNSDDLIRRREVRLDYENNKSLINKVKKKNNCLIF